MYSNKEKTKLNTKSTPNMLVLTTILCCITLIACAFSITRNSEISSTTQQIQALILSKYENQKLQYVTKGKITSSEFIDSYLFSIWDEDRSCEEIIEVSGDEFNNYQIGDTIQLNRIKTHTTDTFEYQYEMVKYNLFTN